MKLNKMTDKELEQYREYCIRAGNVSALTEINEHKKFYGKRVEVIKGRKIPHGTTGTVFYVERVHYGYQDWKGWVTRIGFKDDSGKAFFINDNNLSII